MKIYISGPITGMPNNNREAFSEAARLLQSAGHEVVNPFDIDPSTNKQWHEYMRADIKALCDCDALAWLPGSANSKGAMLEIHIAQQLGMKVCAIEAMVPICDHLFQQRGVH